MQKDFRLGPWLVQPSLNTIATGEGIKRIEPKMMQVLVCLAENCGEVVPKEQLMTVVWPNTYVTDDALLRCVSEVRKALEDDAREPRFIQTITKRGYRLIAPVTWAGEGDETPKPAPKTESEKVGWRTVRQRTLVWAGLVLLPLLAGIAYIVRQGQWLSSSTQSGEIVLAALPFENLSGDPAEEYFSDGLTEEMITQMGRLQPERLKVISRTSAMHYKKTTKRVDQIGRELGVSYLLEGSVRRDGDRVRIAAQLIRVSDQTHLWADSYDREIRDILALQSNVARAIAEKIRLTLTPETINRLGSTRPVQPEAYKANLRARYHLYKWDSEGVSKAIGFSRQAIDFDPTYAPAYALLSEAYSQAAFFSMRGSDAGYSEARAAALRALELDPALAAAHSAAGVVNFYAWDWSGAEREYTRALDLDPNNVDALENYAYFQATMGRPREAIALMKTAVSLDPLTATNRIQLAWNYYAARLYDESISEYAKVIAQDESLEHMRYMIAVNYAKKGMCAEAVAQCKDLSLTPEKVLAIANLGWVFGVCGRRDDALKYLALLDEDASQRRIDPTIRALISTGLGDKERAFGYLNEAYEQRSPWLHCLKSLPTFDELRSDPRRQSLLDRMRLPR